MITTTGVYPKNLLSRNSRYMSSKNNKKVWIDFDNIPHILFFNQRLKVLYKKS